MNVISVRQELIAWYERLGYRKTGETKPLPADHRFGVPTQPLEFAIMEKNMEGRNYFVTETKTVVLDARSCLCVCLLDVGTLCRVHGEFSKTLPSLVR